MFGFIIFFGLALPIGRSIPTEEGSGNLFVIIFTILLDATDISFIRKKKAYLTKHTSERDSVVKLLFAKEAAETSTAPSANSTAPALTCIIATVASMARLTKTPAPTCISATTTSTARSSITTLAPLSTSRSAVTEPSSTTQSTPPTPTLGSSVLTSTTLSSTTIAPSTASTSISAASTSTRIPTSSSQMTAQLTSSTQPANRTTLAHATFKLRCFVELSNEEIITYIEKFVKHFQSSISGTIRITVKKSRKLLA